MVEAHSQEVSFSHEHITIEDGLTSNQVYAGLQDQQGFLWFATSNGLNRFDGKKFTQISKKDGLQSNFIVDIAEDKKGNIWIVYGRFEGRIYPNGNIDIYNPITNEIVTVQSMYPDFPFYVSEDNKINDPKNINRVITNEYKELYLLRNDGNIYHLTDDGRIELDGEATEDLEQHDDRGFYRDHDLKFKILDHRYLPIRANESLLNYFDKDGNIKKVSFEEDVPTSRLITETKTVQRDITVDYAPLDSITKAVLSDLFIQAYGGPNRRFDPFSPAMLLYYNKELYIYKDEKCTRLNTDVNIDLRSSEISFFSDRQGNYWICTYNGLHKFSPIENRFEVFFDKQYDIDNNVKSNLLKYQIRSIQTDTMGNIWAGGQNGFAYYSTSDKSYYYSRETELSATFVLHKKGDSIILFNNWAYMFDLSDQENFEKYEKVEFTGRSHHKLLWNYFPINDHRFILGTEGVEFFDIKSKEHRILQNCSEDNSIPKTTKTIFKILQSKIDGNYWAVGNGGCYKISRELCITDYYGSADTLDSSHQLPVQELRDIYEDEEGIFWIATRSEGLLRWDRSKNDFQIFTTLDGLSSNNLYCLLPDEYGQLWISSDYGLVKFDRKTFRTTIYTAQDGIADNEFNRVSSHTAENGQLYFGGINGLTRFHPENFVEDTTAFSAPVRITAFRQFDGSGDTIRDKRSNLLAKNEIILQPDDKFFQIEFALLDFSSSVTSYKYRIEGIDKEWEYITEPSLRISGLPYGKYKLRIAGKSSNESWSENELNIPITVVKPLYLRWWAFILYGLGILALMYFFRQDLVRKASEKAEKEKLEEIDALKTKLYTNITHEFRTPLTVIIGMTQQIKEDSAISELRSDLQGNIDLKTDFILRNSNVLLNLINQMLDLSKIDESKLTMDWEHGDIIPLLTYISETFAMYAETKDIRYSTEIEMEDFEMDFDRKKMQKVISNLLSNAIKFTPKGGEISYKIEEIEEVDRNLQIMVRNSGTGISEEEQEKIFDRFYQVDDTLTRNAEGTGIGLALAKELVELMGGSIKVESEAGKGVAFYVNVPVRNNAAVRDESERLIESGILVGTAPLGNSESEVTLKDDASLVLLIEDNADVAAYTKSCIEELYTVLWAKNGQVGVDMAIEHVPDIIISDVMMPLKDGFQVAEELKSDIRTSHIPIILLTAKSSLDSRIEGIGRGADAYLTKPFDKRELLVRLEKMIEGRKLVQDYYSRSSLLDKTEAGLTPPTDLVDLEVENEFLKSVHSVIEENLSDSGFEIPELVKQLGMSHSQVYRKIKALTGKTVVAYVRSFRLKIAHGLLKTSNKNVSEISYEVGFSDPSYFTKKYTEEYGLLPMEERSS